MSFVDSIDQEQTAQDVQSDLEYIHSSMKSPHPNSKKKMNMACRTFF